MPDDFEVGSSGLPLYRYQDWRDLIVQRWQAAYGPDADTRSETPDGLMVDTLTLLCTLLGEAAQGVYAGSFFRTAAAPQLDLLLDFFGRERLAALPTTVTAIWYGDASTVVWSGAGAAPVATVESAGPSDGDRYVVLEAGTLPADIAAAGAMSVIRINNVVDGRTYAIDVDGSEVDTDAGPSDTTETIATALAALILGAEPSWTVSAVGNVIVIEGDDAHVYDYGSLLTEESDVSFYAAIRLAMEAEETGPQQVLATTLTGIASAPGAIAGVINEADGSLGRDVETDADFRARHIDTINIGGKGTPQRIRAAILDELPDPLTEYVRVDENITPFTVEGRPPHSFEVTWIGTATAAQVAAVVFDQKPAGIRAFGDVEIGVTDSVGDIHRIGVSPGTERYLHLDIEVTAGEGFDDSGDPEEEITEAVVTYLEERLGLGSDLYLVAVVAAVVGALDGVAAVTVTTATTLVDPGAPLFAAADVTVASNEILRVDSTRITVTIV